MPNPAWNVVVESVLYPNYPLKPVRERAEIRGTGIPTLYRFDSAFGNQTADRCQNLKAGTTRTEAPASAAYYLPFFGGGGAGRLIVSTTW